MPKIRRRALKKRPSLRAVIPGALAVVILTLPLAAHAQSGGTPFDTGFTALQNLFTGTIAKVASLIAIGNTSPAPFS
jgi:type IV secretory pathway VirB2 component (pilin)